MSDWMDLQLAHSLTPAKAPDALWSRINGAAQPARPRWQDSFRRGTLSTVAAAMLFLLVRATAVELRPPHEDFVANTPVAAKKWLAHEPQVQRVRLEVSSVRSESGCKTCHTL